MPRLRRVSAQQAIRELERPGFVQARQRGSHVVLKKQTPQRRNRLRCALA